MDGLIRQVIDFIQGAGFTVIATVCDQGGTNRAAINKLVGAVSPGELRDYFYHKDRTIFTIFDPPHLLKCTRNLLMAHPLHLNQNVVVRWKHIVDFYKRDTGSLRMAQKLSDLH